MNIEKTCADAIAVVERYLANDVPAYDMRNELYEARGAVGDSWEARAWDVCKSHKPQRICRAAWHACDTAKDGEVILAKKYVEEYEDLVK